MPGPKPGAKPGVASRQGGGFRSGFGNFNEEHMEQQSMAASAQQNQLTQQTSNSAQTSTGGSALQQAGSSQEAPAQEQTQPREVGTFKQEAKLAVKDVANEVKGFFDFNKFLHKVLGISNEDTPEEKQTKETILKNFNKLDDEQKQIVQKKVQEKQQKDKAAEEERQAKEQQKAREQSANIAPPSSPKKGAKGQGGSKSQKASTQLQQNRQTIGKVQGAI